ncbi:MAG: hypothetical protein Q7S74_05575 [Nanoarchaeota archaeon]|nr:hypothetical protein [Nanoarchaeota archaeon]
METVTLSKDKYEELMKKAALGDDLLIKLIRGLEDIRAGRIKRWEGLESVKDC